MNPDLLTALKAAVLYIWRQSHATKTYDYFLETLNSLINSVYTKNLGGEFVDIMSNLIDGQLSQAFEQAWADDGNDTPPPDYLQTAAHDMIAEQQGMVRQFYQEIIDAQVDELGTDALLSRASLWANRWNEAYNQAVHLIQLQMGGKEVWRLGATEQHCPTCSALDGIVAYASEWEQLGVHPQQGPNDLLVCGGWRCDCSLSPTNQRRSPKAFESILNAVTR